MTPRFRKNLSQKSMVLLTTVLISAPLWSSPAIAQVTAYKQAVAEAASSSDDVAAFYRGSDYAPIWTGEGAADTARRAALIKALSEVETHGLPGSRYDVAGLMEQMKSARTTRDVGMVEVALSRVFLRYARDVQTGVLVPSSVDPGIVRNVFYPEGVSYLNGLANSDPADYFAQLPPRTQEYTLLRKEKLRLEQLIADGGWGSKVTGSKLEPGDGGASVVSLRNRLIRMGFMAPNATATYDAEMEKAVQRFQLASGLEADGVAGSGTISEINTPAEDRLKSVIVALERERWITRDRGDRHVLVNLTDFTAKIVERGQVVFESRSVIGKNQHDRRSPEFSDVMEHMIINPSWHVPRSIVTKEYLPALKNNPHAAGHILITDSRGRTVDRSSMDFTQFSARSFPFSMRQPPSSRNALGLVKFMFPNKHNIYLHDTPQKSLFAHETRAYSHGCIRLADPFGFAYALLSVQSDDPKDAFHSVLKSGRETKVELEKPLPVHLIYRTAFISPKGQAEFRRDVYGRDAKIWDALSQAGVVLPAVQG